MIPIFYRPEQNGPGPEDHFVSLSAAKPQHVVESWLKRFGADQLEMKTFKPSNGFDLSRAHDGQYVYKVLQGETENGFGNKSLVVAKSLPYVVGSMVAAARYAFGTGGVAVSPTSGFHHAGYDFGEGYCTFNGLIVAATAIRGVGPIGILDCDAHYGNGTDDIIKRCQLERDVLNHTTRRRMPPFGEYLDDLVNTLQYWATKRKVSLVLYQAGADPHINDPFGGHFTSEQLQTRDAVVFETCKSYKLPIAWNLAGGYQVDDTKVDFAESIRPVLDIHDATMAACIKVYGSKS